MTDPIPPPTPGAALRAKELGRLADRVLHLKPRALKQGHLDEIVLTLRDGEHMILELVQELRVVALPPEGRPLEEETESAVSTLKSIAAMLGWLNLPPRETLERDIAALKSRAEGRQSSYSRAEFERDRMGETGDRLAAEGRAPTETLPSGWQEKHRWPPYTHGRIVCQHCQAVVATCQCPLGCEIVGTVVTCPACAEAGDSTVHPVEQLTAPTEMPERLRVEPPALAVQRIELSESFRDTVKTNLEIGKHAVGKDE